MSSMTPQQLITALSQEKGIAREISATGFVKKGPGDDVVLFSLGFTCRAWISIPIGLIQEVTPVAKLPCHDHEHEGVQMTFVPPESPQARVFAELYQAATEEQYDLAAAVGAGTTAAEGDETGVNPCRDRCTMIYRGSLARCNRIIDPRAKAACILGASAVYALCNLGCPPR